MDRLPFDSGKVPKRVSRSATGDAPVSVSKLSELIKDVLVEGFRGKVRVVGEVSNFSARGHWYFSLKDAGAALRCVCFASSARNIRFPVSDGIQVIVSGRVDYYEAQGQLQFYVESMEPVGQGALEMKFRALCEELRGLGYFEESRKRPLPLVPLKIAVVTSRTGAALQDVLKTAAQRWAGCEIVVMDTRVQGAAAAPEIAAAIRVLSEQGPTLGIEAILLTRGGGSLEDLWAFNERIVADAVFECRLPVVAAIGHETDITVAELVADRRASTPTQAVMALIPDGAALSHQVTQIDQRLTHLLKQEYTRANRRLESMASRPSLRRPETWIQPWQARLETAGRNAVFRRPADLLEQARRKLDALARHPVFKKPQTLIDPLAARLEQIKRHAVFRKPEQMYQPGQERLAAAKQRLEASMQATILRQSEQLAVLIRHLQMVGPTQVLSRGYSYTLNSEGKVVRTPEQVESGEQITTVLSEGTLISRVVGESLPGQFGRGVPERPATPSRPQRKKRRSEDEGTPGLFK